MTKPILLLSLLLACCAHAQSSTSIKNLGVRFLAERGAAEVGQVTLVSKDLKSSPFELPMNYLSKPQTPPARSFSVWSTTRNAAVAVVRLPDEGNSFIIILVPSPKAGYDPIIIADGDPKFRQGDIYFYNHADKTVLGYVGNSKFILAPSNGSILRPEGPDEEGVYYNVGLGVREKDRDRPLSTARWPVQKRMRTYVLFFINPKTQRIDFRAVDEYIEPVASAR